MLSVRESKLREEEKRMSERTKLLSEHSTYLDNMKSGRYDDVAPGAGGDASHNNNDVVSATRHDKSLYGSGFRGMSVPSSSSCSVFPVNNCFDYRLNWV